METSKNYKTSLKNSQILGEKLVLLSGMLDRQGSLAKGYITINSDKTDAVTSVILDDLDLVNQITALVESKIQNTQSRYFVELSNHIESAKFDSLAGFVQEFKNCIDNLSIKAIERMDSFLKNESQQIALLLKKSADVRNKAVKK